MSDTVITGASADAAGARVALVTGAAHRIGRAITLALAADGWAVGVHVRGSTAAGDALAADIVARGGRAAVLAADLADPAAVDDLVPACTAALGAPTCLVNNAAQFDFDTFATMTAEAWRQHMDVNLRAPVFLAQALAQHLPAGAKGNVINLIDQRVLRPTPDYFSYGVAKAALWDATRLMAQALGPCIRVNAIAPGPTLANVHQRPEDFAAEARSTLLGHGTTPEEIAAAVRFLLDAPAITGQMIALDGGQHLTFDAAAGHASSLAKPG